MKKNSHLIVFILINIFVAAVTTLAVLWLWERAHPRPEITLPAVESTNNDPDFQANPDAQMDNEDNPAPEPTLAFISSDPDVVIRTIVGAGNVEVEYVEILNQSEGPVDMTGWQLKDEQSNTFTFPTLILNSGGAIKVLSKKGVNTVIELYWQEDTAMWQSGETAVLQDAAGEIVTTYSIP